MIDYIRNKWPAILLVLACLVYMKEYIGFLLLMQIITGLLIIYGLFWLVGFGGWMYLVPGYDRQKDFIDDMRLTDKEYFAKYGERKAPSNFSFNDPPLGETPEEAQRRRDAISDAYKSWDDYR